MDVLSLSERDETNTSEGRFVFVIRKRSVCLIRCPIHALAAGSANEIILAA